MQKEGGTCTRLQHILLVSVVVLNRNTAVKAFRIVLGLLVAFSITSLVFFGFWVPFHSSLVWLISCIMAIFFDVVVLENLFILVQAFICNFRLVKEKKVTTPFNRRIFSLFLSKAATIKL
mgnify:FL=1